MDVPARARIVMWEGAGLWVVDATSAQGIDERRTDFHAHHAIQVTFGLGGRFALATADETVRDQAVTVAADIAHAFDAEGLVAIVFIEPESRVGRAAAHKLLGEAAL